MQKKIFSYFIMSAILIWRKMMNLGITPNLTQQNQLKTNNTKNNLSKKVAFQADLNTKSIEACESLLPKNILEGIITAKESLAKLKWLNLEAPMSLKSTVRRLNRGTMCNIYRFELGKDLNNRIIKISDIEAPYSVAARISKKFSDVGKKLGMQKDYNKLP